MIKNDISFMKKKNIKQSLILFIVEIIPLEVKIQIMRRVYNDGDYEYNIGKT